MDGIAPKAQHQERVKVDKMADSARNASEFLKALAHESWLMILCNLLDGEKSVGDLETSLSLRQSTVSQQLARLRLERLVSARRDGKTIHYSIADDKVRAVIGVLYNTFCGVRPNSAASRKRSVRRDGLKQTPEERAVGLRKGGGIRPA